MVVVVIVLATYNMPDIWNPRQKKWRFPHRWSRVYKPPSRKQNLITLILQSRLYDYFALKSIFNVELKRPNKCIFTSLFPDHVRFPGIECWLANKVSISSKTWTLHTNILVLLLCYVFFSKCWNRFDGCLNVMSSHADEKQHKQHGENYPVSDSRVQ